jgi:ParB family chromosome partitioning protein
MAKQSLGKGFDALIPKDIDQAILEEDKHRVQKILIQDIVPNPDQPRREFDEGALKELTMSIKRHGVLQPIMVVRANNGSGYRIVAGERRWRAAKAAQLAQIPAIVRSLEELEQVELALIENIQREDLSPLEQAMAVYRLQQQFNLTLESVAEKLGKAPSTVSNLTRLLQLPESAREALRSGKISEGHARAILALKNNSTKKGATSSKARGHTASENELTKVLTKQLGHRVKIKHTAKGGQLIISFGSEDELNSLAQKLQNN